MLDQRPLHSSLPRPVHAPFPRVVCVVEPTPESDVAVEQAITLAGNDTRVCFTAMWNDRATRDEAAVSSSAAEARVERAVARARQAGVSTDRLLVRAATIGEVLVRVTTRQDLIVVGAHAHARATGVVLGETATFLVHRSPIPVLLARKPPLSAGVIAATRALPPDRAALTAATRTAAFLGAELTVVHVEVRDDDARRPELHAELANARALLGRPLDFYRDSGAAARAIVAAAEGDGAGLVVVGSDRRTGLSALTSVSERVAHHAPCSVLVMRSA